MEHRTVHKIRPPGQRVNFIRSLDRIRGLADREKEMLRPVIREFPFWINSYYLNLIDWNNPHDPLRRLIIPDLGELDDWGESDVSNEKAVTVADGVQHKYPRTVLFLVTENCAGCCRYCFRKRIFRDDGCETAGNINEGLDYIKARPEVDNVLLTGGDPLMLSTRRLENIIRELRSIEHIRIIRLGTKIPAFNPRRILDDPELPKMLARYSYPESRIYMIAHFDHPRELTCEARKAVNTIQAAGVIILNQNPIIRGISDQPDTMATLWKELSYLGVAQYYVFQTRPTIGNKPYTVPIVEAYFKIEEAKKRCSGLAKRIKYVMSHSSGKIEIVGVDRRHIYMKYHRAKHPRDDQRFFVCYRDDEAFWLDQLKPADRHRSNNEFRGMTLSPSWN